MTDEEYTKRLRARFVERAGEGADAVVDACDLEDFKKGGYEEDPEGAADEEMSYWDDDGDES